MKVLYSMDIERLKLRIRPVQQTVTIPMDDFEALVNNYSMVAQAEITGVRTANADLRRENEQFKTVVDNLNNVIDGLHKKLDAKGKANAKA